LAPIPSSRPANASGPPPGSGNPNPRLTGSLPEVNGPKNHGRIGERTNEAWADQKVLFYYAVVEAMLKMGFTEEEIEKIGCGNFCRVFSAATTSH
jgi:membrane dipeptidase